MKYDINKLPDGRGAERKYPWEKLDKIGDWFKWSDTKDRGSIYGSARAQNIKVAIRNIDNGLLIMRTK